MKSKSVKYGAVMALMVAVAALSGCQTQPTTYQTTYASRVCQSCGVVQQVQQIYIQQQGTNNSGIGTVIGAVAGGLLGSTIGHGRGNTAAIVGGAVVGGVVGNKVGQANSQPAGTVPAWQIIVRLDNGQYATVTQVPNPGVRPGDYVVISNNLVYPR
ncbi:glycine zipper 2TM domain-containing protein [Dyella monticola]|uniref:Glycine zipper 2TM domain-containing protein n=1 Tax=Dyella monticola TaxID=1927958 RepID=A0A370WX45_9GAMM|nr:glycine zipper 2TM domain-containing protein [Dyella monticola]RDS80555.1 glycine zipper 2TM domain-containing protein [Dyella monticola]